MPLFFRNFLGIFGRRAVQSKHPENSWREAFIIVMVYLIVAWLVARALGIFSFFRSFYVRLIPVRCESKILLCEKILRLHCLLPAVAGHLLVSSLF